MWSFVLFILCSTFYNVICESDTGIVVLTGRRMWTMNSSSINATYEFFDGETLNVTCYRLINKYQFVMFTDVLDSKLTYDKPIPHSSKSMFMYLRLTKENHGNNISCLLYDSTNLTISSTFRLNLKYKSDIPASGYQINGTYSTPKYCSSNNTQSCFEYHYYDGENVSVKFVNNKTLKRFTCEEKGLSDPKILTLNENVMTYCHADILKTKLAELQFVPNYFYIEYDSYAPVIKGMSMARTIAILRKKYTHILIVYEYYDDEELTFDCVGTNVTWDYTNNSISVTNNVTSSSVISFKLISSTNQTNNKVYCSSEIDINKYSLVSTTIIMLIRTTKPTRPVSMEFDYWDDVTEAEVTSTSAVEMTAYKEKEKKTREPRESSNVTIPSIIGGSVAVLVLVSVIVAFVLVKILKKKPKINNTDSNIDYETLPDHKQGAMPIPKQWDEAQYSNPNDALPNNSDYAVPHKPTLEEMYARISPKNKRNNDNNETGYVTIDQKLSPTYAQAVPKHLRKNNTKNLKYAELETKIQKSIVAKNATISRNPYAEIKFQESPYAEPGSESSYAEIGSECAYAEVNFGENQYAEPNAKLPRGYVNVFDNQRYVNSQGKDDYAEPAYCELSKRKK